MARRSDTHHVVPALEGGWVVRRGGSSRASKHFDRKRDAVVWGRALSEKQGTEFVIHHRDGTIQSKQVPGDPPL